jgi:hypothetical protein
LPDLKEPIEAVKSIEPPLVFISHDSRDADLAESFSKLLKSVSAGMLKCFRSSDKKSTEGIEFGDEWYKTLMGKLDKASDVVCLLTERSLERPWILYETGVAKGKRDTPVHGIALGVPLGRVSAGPFYQFQNSDDSEESLSKLVLQLCRRITNLEPDADVVIGQVRVFKQNVSEVLKTIGGQKKPEKQELINESAVAKVLEEMKLIVREFSMRSEAMTVANLEGVKARRGSSRDFDLPSIDKLAYIISNGKPYPIGILMIASSFRDDLPWFYELGLDAFRKASRSSNESTRRAIEMFRNAAENIFRGPYRKEISLGMTAKEREFLQDVPMLIEHYTSQAFNAPATERIASARSVKPKNTERL